MQYVIYFAVATPLLLGWLFYESATIPPQRPLFVSGLEHLSTRPVVADTGRNPATNQLARNDTSATE